MSGRADHGYRQIQGDSMTFAPKKATFLVLLALSTASLASAQDPTKLPGVVSRADSSRTLRGVVLDTAGIIVPDAEVLIGELKKRMLSRADGTFSFSSMPKGTFEIRARKIGYAPQVKTIKISGDGGSMEPFELVPMARALPAVVTAVGRLGLSGVVADTSFAGLPGVQVRVVGSGLETLTDSDGTFYMPAHRGMHFVTVHKDGFRDRMVSVVIPDDSGRRITVSLVPGQTPVREQANILELQHRIARVTEPMVNLFSRERLKSMGVEWAYEAAVSGWIQGGKTGLPDFACYAMINGGPNIARLNSISIDEIESIEVYSGGDPFGDQKARAGQSRGSGTAPAVVGLRAPTAGARGKAAPSQRGGGVVAMGPQGVADSRPAMDINNAESINVANQGMNCPSVYVWTR
jgi:hypothetical protein